MADAIMNGMPEVGWEGDPLLRLEFDNRTQEWLIRDHAFNPPQVFLRKAANGIRDLDFRELCTKLREGQFKGQGAQTIIERVIARNEARDRDEEAKNREFNTDVAERLAWGIRKDLD